MYARNKRYNCGVQSMLLYPKPLVQKANFVSTEQPKTRIATSKLQSDLQDSKLTGINFFGINTNFPDY
jgi:hypothetical protein